MKGIQIIGYRHNPSTCSSESDEWLYSVEDRKIDHRKNPEVHRGNLQPRPQLVCHLIPKRFRKFKMVPTEKLRSFLGTVNMYRVLSTIFPQPQTTARPNSCAFLL